MHHIFGLARGGTPSTVDRADSQLSFVDVQAKILLLSSRTVDRDSADAACSFLSIATKIYGDPQKRREPASDELTDAVGKALFTIGKRIRRDPFENES